MTTDNTRWGDLVPMTSVQSILFSVCLFCLREKGLCLGTVGDLLLGPSPWLIPPHTHTLICRYWNSWTLMLGFFWKNSPSFIFWSMCPATSLNCHVLFWTWVVPLFSHYFPFPTGKEFLTWSQITSRVIERRASVFSPLSLPTTMPLKILQLLYSSQLGWW